MRQVSGCDFCGGTPSGTFEVLPARYDPANAGKRMVLCDHCRDALASILDPLLDAKANKGDVEPQVESTDGRPVSDGTGERAAASESLSNDEDAEQTAESDHSTDVDAEESTDTQMAKTGAGTSSRVPKGYRKVVRFLENRELPLDVDDAVEMTAGAYDLDEDAVVAAIEHADSHGRLRMSQGEIREP